MTLLRRVAIALLIALAAVCVRPVSARAAQEFAVRCEAVPGTLASPGQVMLAFTLRNETTQYITQVEVRYGQQLLASYGTLAPGQTQTLQAPGFEVSASMLGVPIAMTYTYRVGELLQSGLCSLIVQQINETPKLSFTRTAEPRIVSAGGVVQLVYTLENQGNAPLYALMVSDDMVGIVGEVDTLAVGERRTFQRSYQPTADQLSRPKARYQIAPGAQQVYNVELEPLEIKISKALLSVQVSTSASQVRAGEAIDLNLLVFNQGNVDYVDLRVMDSVMGKLAEIPLLEVTRTYQLNRIVRPLSDTTYQFVVAAKSAKDGTEVLVQSVPIFVKVIDPAPQVMRVRLSAVPDAKTLRQEENVRFTVNISNETGETLSNVQLIEASLGAVQSMPELPPGDRAVPVDVTVKATTEFFFSLQATMPSGQTAIVKAESVPIVVRPETGNARVTPALTPRPSGNGNAATPRPTAAATPVSSAAPPAATIVSAAATRAPAAAAPSPALASLPLTAAPSAASQAAPPSDELADRAMSALQIALWVIGVLFLLSASVYLVMAISQRRRR